MKPDKTTLGNIITAVLTPLVGAGAAYLAKHGLALPTGAVVTLGVAGAAATLTMGWHWVQRQTEFQSVEHIAEHVAGRVNDAIAANPATEAAKQTLLHALESQTGQLLDALSKAVHLPPSAEEVAKEILGQVAAEKPSVHVHVDGESAPIAPPPNAAIVTSATPGIVSQP